MADARRQSSCGFGEQQIITLGAAQHLSEAAVESGEGHQWQREMRKKSEGSFAYRLGKFSCAALCWNTV